MSLLQVQERLRSVGVNEIVVSRKFRCPNEEADGHRLALWLSEASGFSGKLAPVCLDVETEEAFYDTETAQVNAQWRTRGWQEWLYQNKNKGIVFTQPSQSSSRPRRDLDNQLIEGESETTSAHQKWLIKEGENFALRPKELVVVKAIVDDRATYIDPLNDKMGFINDAPMPILGDPDGGHLLFLSKTSVPIFDETPLWDMQYSFLRHSLPWNEQCVTEAMAWIAVAFPFFTFIAEDIDLETISGFREKWLNFPTGATRTHRLFETEDFSWVNEMCT